MTPQVDEAFGDTPFGFDPIVKAETPPEKVVEKPVAEPDPAKVEEPDPEAAPAGETMEEVVKGLTELLADMPDKLAESVSKAIAPAGEPKPAAKSEIDAVMETLEDHPQELRDAVRAALEKGVQATEVLQQMQDAAAEQSLVNEIAETMKSYPGLTEADVRAGLAKTAEIGKSNPALADELSFEEILVRAIGSQALAARRTQAPAPKPNGAPKGAPAPGGKSKPAAAEIVGDATPGATSEKPWDPGPGNDFSDIGRHIYETAGDSLVIRGK